MECCYNLIKEGSDSRELVWRKIKELRTTLVDSFIRFWHQAVRHIDKSTTDFRKRFSSFCCAFPHTWLHFSCEAHRGRWLLLFVQVQILCVDHIFRFIKFTWSFLLIKGFEANDSIFFFPLYFRAPVHFQNGCRGYHKISNVG